MSKEKPVPLDRDALRAILAPDAAPPVDLTKPAFGDVRHGEVAPVPLAEREQGAYQWTRENYLDFVDRSWWRCPGIPIRRWRSRRWRCWAR